jgi:hypothetical protein
MKYTSKLHIFLMCLLMSVLSYAFDSHSTEKQANYSIEKLYNKLNRFSNNSMAYRIDWISSQFLGNPYILFSLGEGPQARYDQFPKYRIDGFDCETYVDTVLALAFSSSLSSFQQCIDHIRYKNGTISYLQRNHFTGLDWNQNNQQLGLVKDITLSIKDQNNQAVALVAEALVNKPNWYAFKALDTIRLAQANKTKASIRLAELKQQGAQLEIAQEKVPYLPFTVLFLENRKPNMYLFAQIPHGSIIEIVRPNWNLSQLIGTSLNISHLGFAIRKKDQLFFRQASSEYAKVIDVPLIEYLQKALDSPTIKGINVQIILPKNPLAKCSK